MDTFTVIFDTPGILGWQYFICQADDPGHAEEQCLNAYPGASVLWVNEGEDYAMQ
jgi:hypothetical protein